MNAPLLIAGAGALLAAGIHGIAGEILVVRKLSTETLASSPFGGPRMTRTMIHASWHLTTVGFLVAAAALLLSGSVLDGDAARALAYLGAGACTGFAVVVLVLGMSAVPGSILRHPAPVLLTAVVGLAWWGALSVA